MRLSTVRLAALLLGLFLLLAPASQAQLSGTYYVGAPGTAPIGNPDFATLKAATDAANAGGVTGNVTLLVTSNLTEAADVRLGVNTGGFTFTIKPEPGKSPVVTFTQTTTDPATAAVWGNFVIGSPTALNTNLVPTHNVTIDGSNTVGGTSRDLTMRGAAVAAVPKSVLRTIGDNDNLTIKNVVFETAGTVSTGLLQFSANGDAAADNLVIQNNSITNTGNVSSSGITLARFGTLTPVTSPTGLQILDNALTFRLRGINMQWRDSGDLARNTFTIVAGSNDTKGIFLGFARTGASGTLNIHSNRFASLATSGINGMMGVDNQLVEPITMNVYNNVFTGFSTTAAATSQRIFAVRHAFAAATTNVYHNTVYMADLTDLTAPGTTVIAAFAFVDNTAGNNTAPAGTMNVQNNLVVIEETTMKVHGLYRAGTAGTFTSDGNVVSTPGAAGNFGFSNGADRTTLAAWRNATLQDRNSRVKAPTFASLTTLALSGASLGDADLTGLALAVVPTDIDGQPRSTTAPYVGADEVTPALTARIVNLTAGVVGNATASELVPGGGRLWAFFNTSLGAGVGIEINSLAGGVPTGDFQRFACVFDNTTVGRPAGANYRCDVYTTPPAFPSNPTAASMPASFKNATVRYQFFTADYGTLNTNAANFTGFAWSFTTDAGGAPLPVELSAFEAVASGSGARLTWTTESETNNAGFAVEQQTGGAFAELDFVAGKGTTSERTTYRYDVAALAAGRHTFRLKQVDVDGTATYSPTVEVTIGIDGQVEVSNAAPNPFTATTGLTLRLAREQRVSVRVYDLSGRHVQTLHDGVLVAGEAHRFTVDGADLSSGVYLVRVTGEHFAQTRQVTLVR